MRARIDIDPLLKQAGLTAEEMKNARVRIAVKTQIRFLNLVAKTLGDDFLGFRLAQEFDLRELGLLYYVQASSESLGEALRRLARYSGITNEGVHIRCFGHNGLAVTFEYIGVARLEDRHQIEFFVTTLVRVCRQLTGRHLLPSSVKLFHRRADVLPGFGAFFGCEVIFGQDFDEVSYPRSAECLPNVNADPYLNKLLVKYCSEALSRRRPRAKSWRSDVENAIVPLLPHGQAGLAAISHQLGVSRRTLARRLKFEGLTFAAILDALRFDLAKRYLQEIDLPISEVAWLLGYAETSAFNHAFKRWSGKTPNQMRSILSRLVRSGQRHVDDAHSGSA
jgi:AraC-like DNA-binding protein